MSYTDPNDGEQSPAKRTIHILYIPGGAMLGVLPAMMLKHLEDLTDMRIDDLFQVMEGVSAGSILVAAMSTPGVTAEETLDLFLSEGPRFFPEIPNREIKMIAANFLNVAKNYLNIDPKKTDYEKIQKLHELCDELSEALGGQEQKTVDEIRKYATKRWITNARHSKVLKMGESLVENHKGVADIVSCIAGLMKVRTHTNRISIPFKEAARGIMDAVTPKNYMLDPKIMEDFFKELFEGRKISDSSRSTYISAFDIQHNEVVTFSNRKEDFLDPDSDNAEVTNDLDIWDVIMATTANPFAFPPHITQNGIVCSDKAIIHNPQNSVDDVLVNKDDDVEVKLIIFGTGRYITEEMEKTHLRDSYSERGVAGNLIGGSEIAELENYALSLAVTSFRKKLGEDNVIDFSPRLTPLTPREKEEFPGSPLDASPENMDKLINRGERFIVNNEEAFRDLAKMLVQNLLTIGEINAERYAEIIERIDNFKLSSVELEEAINCQESAIEKCNREFKRSTEALDGESYCGSDDDHDDKMPPPPSSDSGSTPHIPPPSA